MRLADEIASVLRHYNYLLQQLHLLLNLLDQATSDLHNDHPCQSIIRYQHCY